MKRIVLALAVLALALPAFAHDPHREAAEALADLKARHDLAESHNHTQGMAITELFRMVDDLRARVDAVQGSQNGQSAAIDELFRLIDELAAGGCGLTVTEGDE